MTTLEMPWTAPDCARRTNAVTENPPGGNAPGNDADGCVASRRSESCNFDTWIMPCGQAIEGKPLTLVIAMDGRTGPRAAFDITLRIFVQGLAFCGDTIDELGHETDRTLSFLEDTKTGSVAVTGTVQQGTAENGLEAIVIFFDRTRYSGCVRTHIGVVAADAEPQVETHFDHCQP